MVSLVPTINFLYSKEITPQVDGNCQILLKKEDSNFPVVKDTNQALDLYWITTKSNKTSHRSLDLKKVANFPKGK